MNREGREEQSAGAEALALLWAAKIPILFAALVGAMIGGLYAYGTAPVYQADSLLQIEKRNGGLALSAGLQSLMEGDASALAEIEILRSRMVLGEAVARLNLRREVEPLRLPLLSRLMETAGLALPEWGPLRRYPSGGEEVALGLLEVPRPWEGRPILLTVGEEGGFALTLPDGTGLTGRTGVTIRLSDPPFALRLDRMAARPGRQFALTLQPELLTIQTLRKRLAIVERGRQTSILEARLTGGDRAKTQAALNAITAAYLAQNVNRSAAEAESSLEFLERQLPEAETAVARAQEALNAYRQEQRSVDLSYETQSILEQATQIEARLAELRLQEEEIKRRYTPNHPIYQTLLSNMAQLRETLGQIREQSGALPETQREIFNLTRDLDVAQQVQLQLLNRAQELRVLRASTIGNVRIIDGARTAPLPVAPRKSMILALSMLLGAVAAGAFVLTRRHLRKGISGAEDLERMELPVLATVPHSDLAAHQGRGRKGRLDILALERPDDIAVEALRSLRTALHFCMMGAGSKSLMLTSPAPGIGKSFLSVNLAAVSALAGQRVCLIDADMRRGYLRRYFDMGREAKGLADHLCGHAGLEEIVHPSGRVPGLSVIPAGRTPPNPAELLLRPAFADLLGVLDGRFDLVVIDTPPVLAVTDPVVIGRLAGTTVIATRQHATLPGQVAAVRKVLAAAGIRVQGAVLNDFVPPKGAAGSYHYNYRYDYKAMID